MVYELIASGDVSDYDGTEDAIAARFAAVANVPARDVTVTIDSASVKITVTIATEDTAVGYDVNANIATYLSDAASATTFLQAAVPGVTIEATPIIREPVSTLGPECRCFANGGENQAFCESGTINDPNECASDARCHWGPGQYDECVAMVDGGGGGSGGPNSDGGNGGGGGMIVMVLAAAAGALVVLGLLAVYLRRATSAQGRSKRGDIAASAEGVRV